MTHINNIRKYTLAGLAIFITCVSLFLGACSDRGQNSGIQGVTPNESIGNQASRTLIRGNSSEPSSLDPQNPSGLPEMMVLYDLFEGLTIPAPDGVAKPGVATHWETSDGLTYRFHLRENARWSNGDRVTAHDFVFSWRRLADPDQGDPQVILSELVPIRNAKAIESGEMPPETLGIQALSDFELKITLSEQVYDFVDQTALVTLMPVHAETLVEHGKNWTRPGNFVSNGAFTLSKWVVNERIEAIRNQYYWDKDNVDLDRVVFLPSKSRKSEIDRFLSGELHITYGIPAGSYEEISRNYPHELHTSMVNGAVGFSINTSKPPFDDAKLRRALAYALNREVFANSVVSGTSRPTYSYGINVTPTGDTTTSHWHELTQLEREKLAKELYQDAGFSEKNPLKLRLLYSTSDENRKLSLAAAAMWKEVLGIDVTLDGREWKVRYEALVSGDFDLALFMPMYGREPAYQYQLIASDGFQNFGNHHDPKYDEIVATATKTLDANQRQLIYTSAEEILAAQMPYIPVYHSSMSRLVSQNVRGYQSTNGMIPLSKFMSLKEQHP